MTKHNLIELAKEFTINAHNSVGHQRKYTNEPYHVHPERVAHLAQPYPHRMLNLPLPVMLLRKKTSRCMIIAAWHL